MHTDASTPTPAPVIESKPRRKRTLIYALSAGAAALAVAGTVAFATSAAAETPQDRLWAVYEDGDTDLKGMSREEVIASVDEGCSELAKGGEIARDLARSMLDGDQDKIRIFDAAVKYCDETR